MSISRHCPPPPGPFDFGVRKMKKVVRKFEQTDDAVAPATHPPAPAGCPCGYSKLVS